MIFVWIIFGVVLLVFTALVVASLFASLMIMGSAIISLSFKRSRKLGMRLFCSSFAGACLGAVVPLGLAPLFGESPSSISVWAYVVWAMFGFSIAGTLAGIVFAGIQAVLLPLKYIKRSNQTVEPSGDPPLVTVNDRKSNE